MFEQHTDLNKIKLQFFINIMTLILICWNCYYILSKKSTIPCLPLSYLWSGLRESRLKFVPGYRGPILTFLSEAWAWFYRVTGDKLNWPAFQSTYLGFLVRFFYLDPTKHTFTLPPLILPVIGSHRMLTKVCTRVQWADFNFPVRSLGIVLSGNWG